MFIFNFAFQKEFIKKDIHDKNPRKLQEDLSDDIVILHINDVHSGLNDTVGYDGFVLYRDEMKKKYKNVITVDVGDHLQGGSICAISNGEAIIKLMNNIEFDVTILGNHEFDYGIEQLQKLGENITSKYICSNFCYNKNKSSIFDPYKVVKAGNKAIGFISVLTPLTLTKTYLSQIKDDNNELLYDFLTNKDVKDLYDRVQGYIDELKSTRKVDYVILLTHFGMDVEDYTSNGLLSHLEKVDAVLDGHTHRVYNTTSKDKNNKDIPISQTGTKLQSIGKLIIKSNGSLENEIIVNVTEPLDKEDAINITRGGQERWVDKKTNEFINSLWEEYSDELNALIGYSNFDLLIREENAITPFCRFKECSLGDLITDAIKASSNTEIAIVNGGSIRNNLKKGNITSSSVIDILPWFSYIIAKQLSGQVILDALEFGVSKLPNAFGGYPQTSGITFDLDPSINSTVKTDNSGNFVNVAGERRVSNVKINGENLNLTRLYNCSLLNFQGSGGDGYTMFADKKVYFESILTDTDSLIYYIKNTLNGTIPEEYKEVQKRVNVINRNESSSNSPSSISHPLLIGFDSFEYLEDSKLIKYLTYIQFANYSNNDVKNITMKVNLNYANRLRLLEEVVVNCNYQDKTKEDIFIFNCLKTIDRPISSLSFIDNSITLDGQPLLNLEKSEIVDVIGKNIQNQKDNYLSYPQYYLKNCDLTKESNSLIIEGENNETKLASNKSFLLFSENDELKNISCEIKDESNNKFKLVCKPQNKVNADLSDNNLVVIKDLQKNLKMTFDNGGNPFANSTINPIRTYTKKSEGGISGGAIVAIILPLVLVLGLITALTIFLRPKPVIESHGQLHKIPNYSSNDINKTND